MDVPEITVRHEGNEITFNQGIALGRADGDTLYVAKNLGPFELVDYVTEIVRLSMLRVSDAEHSSEKNYLEVIPDDEIEATRKEILGMLDEVKNKLKPM